MPKQVGIALSVVQEGNMMDLLERMGALTVGKEGSDWVNAKAGVAAIALAGEKAGGRSFQAQEKVRGSTHFLLFWAGKSISTSGRLLFVSCSCDEGAECIHRFFGWTFAWNRSFRGRMFSLSLRTGLCSV